MEEQRSIVSADALAGLLDDDGVRVVDVRFSLADPAAGGRAYRQGHVPGAVYFHLDSDLSGPRTAVTGRHPLPDPRVFAAFLAAAGIGRDHRVVAYDDGSGAIASRLWWMLRWLGHHDVAVLDGGYGAWTAGAYPVSAATPRPRAADFRAEPDARMVVTSDEVEEGMAAGDLLLVDAREPERFRGEAEPIDPVAGRVPGAVNFPFRDNLGPDGRLLSPQTLRTRWSALLGDHRPEGVACMCGSGVTACLDLLAMELAGLGGARLYAGSWSEWIADPSRPVATGGRS